MEAEVKDVKPDVKEVPVVEKEPAKEPVTELVTEPVAEKLYKQSEVDEITKKIKDNRRKRENEIKQEAAALRRLLIERSERSEPRTVEPRREEPVVQAPKEPKREEYQDDISYIKALGRHEAAQEFEQRSQAEKKTQAENQQRQQQETIDRTFRANEQKARDKYEDYDDVVYNPALPPLHPVVIQAIKESETGADLVFAIASDAEIAMKLSQMTPILALKELGKMEAKLATAGTLPIPQKPVSRAPAPITPVGGKGTVVDDDPKDTDTPEVWRMKRERQIQAQKRKGART